MRQFRVRHVVPGRSLPSNRSPKMLAVAAIFASLGAIFGASVTGGPVSATATGVFTVVDVAAGEDHVCAIVEFPDDSRKLYCWGVNEYGQLGIGNPSDDPAVDGDEIPGYVFSGGRPYATLPVEVLPSGDFTNTSVELISAGVRHTCAVESGTMFCWGSGGSGRLGHGLVVEEDDGNGGSHSVPDESKKYLPQKVSAQSGFLNANVTAISVGDRHTCAIESDVVYCWGLAQDGRVGVVFDVTNQFETPQKVSDGFPGDGGSAFVNSGVESVSAGVQHTCAVKTGVVYCWGAGGSGQNGSSTWDPDSLSYDDDVSDPHLPRKVSATLAFANASVTDIGVWGTVSCAIEGGAMFCWGSGIVMGVPPDVDGYYPSIFTATPVSSGPDGFSNSNIDSFSKAKDGNPEGSHACAIKSGAVYCWGANKHGQLGNGNSLPTVDENGDPLYSATQRVPVKVVDFMAPLVPVSTSEVGVTSNLPTYSNSNVSVVTGGQTFTCAVQSGNLYCWGRNDLGQLGTGDNNSTERSIPWLVFNPSEDSGTPSFDFDIDLDHYRRAADELTSLPDTH